MASPKTLADFHEGQVIDLGSCVVSEEEIIEFAREFDPAPFHIDPEAARQTMIGGLCASGWHTCSIIMRMIADKVFGPAGSFGSPGVEKVRWLEPVRPGDELHGTANIVGCRESAKRPGVGIVSFHFELAKADGTTVLTIDNVAFFPAGK